MVIAFEGMDGVGKSSVAKSVGDNLGIRHEAHKIVSELDIDINDYNKFVKKLLHAKNEKLSLMFYTFRCMFDQEETEDLIVERSMLSTYFHEHKKVSEEEFGYLLSLGCIPDIIFILYASPEERIRRIIGRDPNDEDLKSSSALSDGYLSMLECAHKYNIPYIGINTENRNKEEIVDICSSIIRDAKNMNQNERLNFIYQMNDEFGFDSLFKERMLVLSEK